MQDILANSLDPMVFKTSLVNGNCPLEEVLEDTLLILQSPLLKVGGASKSSNAGSSTTLAEDLMLEEEVHPDMK